MIRHRRVATTEPQPRARSWLGARLLLTAALFGGCVYPSLEIGAGEGSGGSGAAGGQDPGDGQAGVAGKLSGSHAGAGADGGQAANTVGGAPEGGAMDPGGTCARGTNVPEPSPRRPALGTFTGSPHAPTKLGTLTPHFSWSGVSVEGCDDSITYDLQVDDSCDYTGYSGCAFDSPEIERTKLSETDYLPTTPLAVSKKQPVGSRYFWRVRACAGVGHCSNWSQIFYVDVGRQREDFNGDGYADAIGSGGVSPGSARAINVFLGGAIFDPRSDQYIGRAAAGTEPIRFLGDVDGDGYNDLGATDGDAVEARGFVIYFGGADLGALRTVKLSTPEVLEADETVGIYRAGDFDADGFADFIVTDARPKGQSRAYLYSGSGAWAGAEQAPRATIQRSVEQAASLFATSADTIGDANGDGFEDVLLVSAGEARAFLLLGNSSLSPPAMRPIGLGVLCQKGRVVGAGDVNADGFSDAFVGCPDAYSPANSIRGAAIVIYGGDDAPASAQWVYLPQTSEIDGLRAEGLAASVASADVDGDGMTDILFGVLDSASSTTAGVFVAHGASSGIGLVGAYPFGASGASGDVVAADHDADGRPDLVINGIWYGWGTTTGVKLTQYNSAIYPLANSFAR